MKYRLPFILAAWIIADIYFFKAVKTLTTNNIILTGYWMLDLLIAAGFVSLILLGARHRTKVISWMMALTLLTIVPKIFALPILLIEDITRIFRHFPPRSVWVSELALFVAAIPFFSLMYGMTGDDIDTKYTALP